MFQCDAQRGCRGSGAPAAAAGVAELNAGLPAAAPADLAWIVAASWLDSLSCSWLWRVVTAVVVGGSGCEGARSSSSGWVLRNCVGLQIRAIGTRLGQRERRHAFKPFPPAAAA